MRMDRWTDRLTGTHDRLIVAFAILRTCQKNVTAKEGYEEKRIQEINQENNKERKKKSSRKNYTFRGMR
jgi:hypothetical protein